MRVSSIAPAEVNVTRLGTLKGTYSDAFFDSAAVIRKNFPDLPLIASGIVPDIVCYGMGRFVEKLAEVGVDALDTPNYKAVTDPIGLVAYTVDAGVYYIPPVTGADIDMNDEKHRELLTRLTVIGSGELFFVPGISGDTKRICGEGFIPSIQYIREVQKQNSLFGRIIAIGGINTPEDVDQLVRVAGVDGVHFSSAYLNRVANHTSKSEIAAWLREVKEATKI